MPTPIIASPPHPRSSQIFTFSTRMKAVIALGTVFLAYLVAASSANTGIANSIDISTTSGVILGHPALNRTDVIEFLGIPYAASTSGAQRWLPPQRFYSSATFNASTNVSCL